MATKKKAKKSATAKAKKSATAKKQPARGTKKKAKKSATAKKKPARGKSSPKKGYAKGDRVRVIWNGVEYDATVLATAGKDKWKIHYDGYGDNWDEVVGPARIKGRAKPAASSPPAKTKPQVAASDEAAEDESGDEEDGEERGPVSLRGHKAPPLLQALFDAPDDVQWGLKDLDLEMSRDAESMIDSIGGRSSEVAPFGFDRGHHYFGYWLYGERTLENAPIVFVDDTGLMASVIADSLEDYLSVVRCLRDGFCASSAPIYVDAVDQVLGLPIPVEQPIGIGSHKKLVLAAGAPDAALRALFDAENADERKSRDADGQRARDEVVDKLFAFLDAHGVQSAADPYAVVKRAREKHPRFVLHDEPS